MSTPRIIVNPEQTLPSIVIPNEQREEESPNVANRLMRYLPAVDMTIGVAGMTIEAVE